MNTHNLKRITTIGRPAAARPRPSLDRLLVRKQAVSAGDMMKALVLRQHQNAPLGRILVSEGWASEAQVLEAQAQNHGLQCADLGGCAPPARLLARKPAQFWLRHRAVPWMQLGQTVTIAFAHPEDIEKAMPGLSASFGRITPVLARESSIAALLEAHFRQQIAQRAGASVPAALSCRNQLGPRRRWPPLLAGGLLLALAAALPVLLFTLLCCLALCALLMFTGLKLAGYAAHLSRLRRPELPPPAAHGLRRRPCISMLVPLYREADISQRLLGRLCALSYPRSLLEVLLVLEAHDTVTRAAIRKARLPPWVRVVEVPAHGGLTTKPRALNYALHFCRGEIIGVWDAEDAPQGGQLEAVADAFAAAPRDVACFQGVLDYYNPRDNWIARCFTLEYASWFRIVLPGLASLGLVVPLGGTTMFVRRHVLEELGGWDAQNVTEDADLGVRLARAGYRTRMLPAATYEEANCRPWAWMKQRSRWLKGFMVTYLVHMRRPALLWRQLGARQFLGFQAFFLGTIGQFLLAPFLWSFWLVLLGLPHPAAEVLPAGSIYLAAAALVFFELLGLCICVSAAAAAGHRRLALWAPAMPFYFPMGAVAMAKAVYELFACPFFWDKTAHGTPPLRRRSAPA